MKIFIIRYQILNKVYEISFTTSQARDLAIVKIVGAGRKIIELVEKEA